jgi:hypothetical protein
MTAFLSYLQPAVSLDQRNQFFDLHTAPGAAPILPPALEPRLPKTLPQTHKRRSPSDKASLVAHREHWRTLSKFSILQLL